MRPYAHQQKLLDRNPPRQLIQWSTGVGKTPALIWLNIKNNPIGITLVVCPKGIKVQWKKKIEEYDTKRTQRYHVVSKEEFKRDWEGLRNFSSLIVDEVHHFSGTKSQMHKTLIKWLKREQPKYVWIATATSYRSEPFNIYALGLIVNHAPLSWFKFREKFYHLRYLGRRTVWEKNTDGVTQKLLRQYMQGWTDFARLEDCFDMPEQIDEEPEELGLTAEQKKAIKELRMEETNPLVLTTGIHQIENGSLKGNEFRENREYANLKDEKVIELASEHPKLLVFCRYTAQIERLERLLVEKGYRVFTVTGANSEHHSDITSGAEAMKEAVLIAQISVAAGWEVPSFSLVVYASMSYSYLDFVQSRGRVIRGNKLSRHVFMYLFGGEIDKAVLECIREKKDFDPVTYKQHD